MAIQFGGILCPMARGQVTKTQERFQPPIPEEECEDDMAYALARAVEEYKDKVMRGLNALTEEEFDEKVAEFKSFFYPENGTPEELEEFRQKLADFKQKLKEFRTQPNNMLITPGGSSEEDSDDYMGFLQSKINSNPDLQHRLSSSYA